MVLHVILHAIKVPIEKTKTMWKKCWIMWKFQHKGNKSGLGLPMCRMYREDTQQKTIQSHPEF